MNRGDKVRLKTPDNPRLDGSLAEVVSIMPWGAHVATPAAATGRYRALFREMEALGPSAREQGYCGAICDQCGGSSVKRNGTCLLCVDCGETSGCS